MLGLVIRSPWIEKILAGEKMWEIRGARTHTRGPIALIKGGSGRVFGTCRLVDCLGPLTKDQMLESEGRHRIPREDLLAGMPYKNTYAWVLAEARPLAEAVPYRHPPGAVIWVRLDRSTVGEGVLVDEPLRGALPRDR